MFSRGTSKLVYNVNTMQIKLSVAKLRENS